MHYIKCKGNICKEYGCDPEAVQIFTATLMWIGIIWGIFNNVFLGITLPMKSSL